MIDFLGVPLSLVNMSGWGAFIVLAWVVIRLVFKGEVVPRSVLEDVRKDRDARIAEQQYWKEAFEVQRATLDMTLRQNHRLLELSETSAHVLTSLPVSPEIEGR